MPGFKKYLVLIIFFMCVNSYAFVFVFVPNRPSRYEDRPVMHLNYDYETTKAEIEAQKKLDEKMMYILPAIILAQIGFGIFIIKKYGNKNNEEGK